MRLSITALYLALTGSLVAAANPAQLNNHVARHEQSANLIPRGQNTAEEEIQAQQGTCGEDDAGENPKTCSAIINNEQFDGGFCKRLYAGNIVCCFGLC